MLLRKDAKIELLRRVPLFAECSKAELAKIAAAADELSVQTGRELTREGEPGRDFVVIADGRAEVHRRGKLVNSLGAGDFFGEIALMSGAPRTATVTATAPCRVLVLTGRDFRTLLRETPSLLEKVLAALAARVPTAT